MEQAKARMNDGTKPIELERKPYRPKLESVYQEPAYYPDDDGLDILFRQHGQALYKDPCPVPPRDDIILYGPDKEDEYNNSVQWNDCPLEARPVLEQIVKEFWDVFDSDGMKRPILGFMAAIDTGNHQPVTCPLPRYGPLESKVMTRLVDALEKNGLIEDDDGPWGALIVLAGKPHQGHKHWTEYMWRLCVSYRKLNTVTRPFTFLSTRCDMAVIELGNAKYYIILDLAWGYWQMVLHEASKAKTAFFVPGGKKRWTRMPMGALNSHSTFCAMMEKLKTKWEALYKQEAATLPQQKQEGESPNPSKKPKTTPDINWETKLAHLPPAPDKKDENTGSKTIVDDVMLYSNSLRCVIEYFIAVLTVLREHRATINLKKCRFCPEVAEFVGVDVLAEGNAPSKSKFAAVDRLVSRPPATATDLLGIIGFFGFYQQWIPYYEDKVHRWREYKKEAPPPNAHIQDQMRYMRSRWTREDDELLASLGNEIKRHPIRKRPNFGRRFYLKTDWSSRSMGYALCQPDEEDLEVRQAEEEEDRGGPCLFDKSIGKTEFRLHPINMGSRMCNPSEQHYHSHTGELATGVWAFEKNRPFLVGKTFTWMTDCSGLRQIFKTEAVPTHHIQRWKQRLLLYDFTIVHRPARMMTEVDLLSRYNDRADQLREMDEEDNSKKVAGASSSLLSVPLEPVTNLTASVSTKGKGPSTLMAAKASKTRTICEVNPSFASNEEGGQMAAVHIIPTTLIELRQEWNQVHTSVEGNASQPYLSKPQWDSMKKSNVSTDWVVVDIDPSWSARDTMDLVDIVEEALSRQAKAVVVFTTTGGHALRDIQVELSRKAPIGMEWAGFHIQAHLYGSPLEADVSAYVLSQRTEQLKKMKPESRPTTYLRDVLGVPAEFRSVDCEWNDGLVMGSTNETMSLVAEAEDEGVEPGIKAVTGNRAVPVCFVRRDTGTTSIESRAWCPVFSTDAPGPALRRGREIEWKGLPFAVLSGPQLKQVIGVSVQEVLEMNGVANYKKRILGSYSEKELVKGCRNMIPAHARAVIFELLKALEDEHQEDVNSKTHLPPMVDDLTDEDLRVFMTMRPMEINTVTTLPLPSEEEWITATDVDGDLNRVIQVLRDKKSIHTKDWVQKGYAQELLHGRLEFDEGCVYRYEATARRSLRQIRARVVPKSLRQVIIAACHASPFAGHSDEHKTLWRVVTKFWWPSVAKDVRTAVRSCAMCKAVNIVSHESQVKLKTVTANSPFDVVAFDIWSPGKIPSKGRSDRPPCKGVLTGIDVMTGFAGAGEIFREDSSEVSRVLVSRFATTFGLPKMVLVDDGSEFKSVVQRTCEVLMIPFHVVSKENHKAILCERFHRYLNKVNRIHGLNCSTIDDWMKSVSFAVYAWNAAPVDGTNVTRSFAAIAREFPFPVEIAATTQKAAYSGSNGHYVVEHIDGAFPLLFQQRELLRILVEERREHHRSLRNNHITGQTKFQAGDLCIVRVQVQASDEKGPGKLQVRARGPYRVLDQLSDTTYLIQRLPFSQDSEGKPHKPYKESIARMTLLPSTLVIHKHTDGVDGVYASQDNPFAIAPLQHVFGSRDFGTFQKADDKDYAFEKIEDLWSEPLASPDEIDMPVADVDERPQGTAQSIPKVTPEKKVRFATNTKQPTIERNETKHRDTAPDTTHPGVKNPSLPNLGKLVQKIRDSKDKLMFIEYTFVGTTNPKWYLVQAVLPNDQAKHETLRTGQITVTFMSPHWQDASKLVRAACRYWPQVNEYDPTTKTYGKIIPVSPEKIDKFLTIKKGKAILYQDTIHLLDSWIHGPFDYKCPDRSNSQCHRIDTNDWEIMRNRADGRGIETDNIYQLKPLR